MSSSSNIILLLRQAVEHRFGRVPDSPSVFARLSLDIKKITGESLSVSTLKRVFGYVSYPHRPSLSVLSILAIYCGYDGFASFVAAQNDSGFLASGVITAASLPVGARVELRWMPDRRCIVRHTGNARFTVEQAEHAKMAVGDSFRADIFCEGMPLAVQLTRSGSDTPLPYVAGQRHGLTKAQLLSP